MGVILANNVVGFLDEPLAAEATTVQLRAQDESRFPELDDEGEYYYITVSAPSSVFEIMKATAKVDGALTVERGIAGTTPVAFVAGSRVEVRVTAESILDAIAQVSNTVTASQFGKTGGDTIANLVGITPDTDGAKYTAAAYYNDYDTSPYGLRGGGTFTWSSTTLKSQHNGGTVISPTVPWDGTIATHTDYLNKVGETDVNGAGCWVRVGYDSIVVEMFGAVSEWDGTEGVDAAPAIQKAIDAAFLTATDVVAPLRYYIGSPLVIYGGVVLRSGLRNVFAKNNIGVGVAEAEQDFSARLGTLIVNSELTTTGLLTRTATVEADSPTAIITQSLPGRLLGMYVSGSGIPKHTFLATSFNRSVEDGGGQVLTLTKPASLTGEVTLTFQLQTAYVRVAQGSAIEGFTVIRAGLNVPYYGFNDFPEESQAQQDAFFGAGVLVTTDSRFGNSDRRRTARDCRVTDMLILGFGQGLLVGQAPRPQIFDVKGDCINGVFLADIGDVGRVQRCHFFPFLSIKSSYADGVGLKVSEGAAQLRIEGCFMRGFQVAYECNSSNVDFLTCGLEGATSVFTSQSLPGAIGFLFKGPQALPSKVVGCVTQTCDYAIVLQAAAPDLTRPNATDRRVLLIADNTFQTTFVTQVRIENGSALIVGNLFAPALGVTAELSALSVEVLEGVGSVRVQGNTFKNINRAFYVEPGFEDRFVQFGNEFDSAVENIDSKYTTYTKRGFGVQSASGSIYPLAQNQALGLDSRPWDGLWCSSPNGYVTKKIGLDGSGEVVSYATVTEEPYTSLEFFSGNYFGPLLASSTLDFQNGVYDAAPVSPQAQSYEFAGYYSIQEGGETFYIQRYREVL